MPRVVALTQLRRRYSMMDRQLERDNNRLRVLIETMQRDGRPERDIEKVIRKASGRLHRDTNRPSRRLIAGRR